MASAITSAPSNTGNDVASSTNGSQLRVMCWDGATPAFGYEFYNGATGLPALIKNQNITGPTGVGAIKIVDPDVVINQIPGTTTNWNIMLVYVVQSNTSAFQNRIYSEVWQYSTTTNNVTQTGAAIRVDGLNSPAANPNVDVSRDPGTITTSYAVVVYQQNNQVYARTRNMTLSGFTAGGAFTASRRMSLAAAGTTYNQPDVAIHYFVIGSTTYSHVYVTYVEKSSTVQQVRVLEEPYNTVSLGGTTPTSGSPATKFTYQTPAVTDVLEYPRIAAQFFTTGSFDDGYTVVFRKNETGFDDEIYVQTRYNGVDNAQTVNIDLLGCSNVRPVVAYSGDLILVDWTYSGNCLTGSTNTTDVVARRLQWDGNPADVDYLRVNTNSAGTQAVPCVAGRFVNDNYTFFGWHDANLSQMRFKRSYYNNNPLRPVRGGSGVPTPATTTGAETGRVQLYPNPATAATSVRLTVPADETLTDVRVVDLKSGRPLGGLAPTAALRGEEVALRTLLPAGTPAGLYVLRLTTSAGVYTERFEYHP